MINMMANYIACFGRRFRYASILGISLALGLGALGTPHPVLASATLGFSPASGQVTVGSNWTTAVVINSDGAVNSVDTSIQFSAGVVEVVAVDFSGSVFGMSLPGSGSYDNTNGTVRIIQASPSPYSGNGGKVAAITFRAKTVGTASLAIGQSKVIAQDGKGTNVFAGGGNGSLNVVNASASSPTTATKTTTTTNSAPAVTQTRAPVISSSSHPDQNAWYKNKSIDYSWTGGGKGYNYAVDQSPSTDLPSTSIGTVTNASTTVSSDGIWYAHVKTQGDSGWSSTASFKIQIDGAPPGAFVVTTDPAGELTTLPDLVYAATDSGSGIDHYEVQIDGGAWSRQNSPFKVPPIASGSHAVVVRAFDRAGNTTDAQTQFMLKPMAAPIITSPDNKSVFLLGDQLSIQGKADPNVEVDIYINNRRVEAAVSDGKGVFKTSQPLLLFAGAYQIVAKAINKDGITSPPSATVTMTIDARAVKIFGNVWPGWVVLIAVLAIIAGLLLAVAIVSFKLWRLSKRWSAKVRGLNKRLTDDLATLEQQVDASVDANVGAASSAAAAVKTSLTTEVKKVEIDVSGAMKQDGVEAEAAPTGRFAWISTAGRAVKQKLVSIAPHISFGPGTAVVAGAAAVPIAVTTTQTTGTPGVVATGAVTPPPVVPAPATTSDSNTTSSQPPMAPNGSNSTAPAADGPTEVVGSAITGGSAPTTPAEASSNSSANTTVTDESAPGTTPPPANPVDNSTQVLTPPTSAFSLNGDAAGGILPTPPAAQPLNVPPLPVPPPLNVPPLPASAPVSPAVPLPTTPVAPPIAPVTEVAKPESNSVTPPTSRPTPDTPNALEAVKAMEIESRK